MAEENIQLRVRYPGGQAILDKLTSGAKLSDLKAEVAKIVSKKPGEIALRAGYPPTPVTATDETPLVDLGITSGDMVIAEFQESEESKEEARAKAMKEQQQQQQKTNPISQPQGHQGTNQQAGGNFVGEMPLSQEEYDAQLARALAESMGEEVQVKPGDKIEEENLFDPQSNKKPETKPIDLGPQKSDNFDDDEYARKLQEELYQESLAERPAQHNADRPLLGQDPATWGPPLGGGMNYGGGAFGGQNIGGGGFQEPNQGVDNDDEIQRAIQESLKGTQPTQINTGDIELDADLRDVIERSKLEK